MLAIVFICFNLFTALNGQTEGSDITTFRLFELNNPWLQTDNPAGLHQLDSIFPGHLYMGLNFEAGDYKSVYDGLNKREANLAGRSYKKINETIVYGEFRYNNGRERNLKYSDVNNPSLVYPYMLVDTFGSTNYQRENFFLQGALSLPVNDVLALGTNVSYNVGVSSQDRDPRPLNKTLNLMVSPGLIWSVKNMKMGAHFNYAYYTDEMEVQVIQQDVTHAFFQLHGLGTFVYHNDKSFFRLYQRNTYGAAMQFETKLGKLLYLGTMEASSHKLSVDDGRAGGGGNWSYLKNDAVLHGRDWKITQAIGRQAYLRKDQLDIRLDRQIRLGSEFIQQQEQTGGADLEHWVTYGQEDKFYSEESKLELAYSQIRFSDKKTIHSVFYFSARSTWFKEQYYWPNLLQDYQNVVVKSSYLKAWDIQKHGLSVEGTVSYQKNVSEHQDLINSNYIVQKISVPNFRYLIDDVLAAGLSVSLETPMVQNRVKWFIMSDVKWLKSSHLGSRTLFRIKTGVLF